MSLSGTCGSDKTMGHGIFYSRVLGCNEIPSAASVLLPEKGWARIYLACIIHATK
jgi:hypothetical protein